MAAPPKKPASRDVALLYAPTDDGKGARVLRARNGLLEAGEVRPVKDGQPINQGELVRLVPHADAPCVCEVETLHQTEPHDDAQGARGDDTGAGRPAQVASKGYRTNWDRTFGVAARRAKRDTSLN